MPDMHDTLIFCFKHKAMKILDSPLLERAPEITEDQIIIRWETGQIHPDEVTIPIESLDQAEMTEGQFIVEDSLGKRIPCRFFDISQADTTLLIEEALINDRIEEADHLFAHAELEMEVEAVNGWESDGDIWTQTVFYSNPEGGDSIKGSYVVHFCKDDSRADSHGPNYGR